MVNSVPYVPGRRAMFSVDELSDGKRQLFFRADKVVKLISDFDSYSADQRMSLPEIQRAYEGAKGCPFLLKAVVEPAVSAHGTYIVECKTLGYSCSFKSDQDFRWMA